MKNNKLNRVIRLIISVLLILPCLPPTSALAGPLGCQDTILDPDKDTRIKYHTNHFVWNWFMSKCEKQSGTRYQDLPETDGRSCAEPRIDGCSLHESKYLFTERDKNLMKAACNRHDLCYSTYGTTKLDCDSQFGVNLDYAKSKFDGTYTTSVIVAAVLALGDHASGQRWGKAHNCKQ